MKTVLIVWYSRTGGSEQMARAAVEGASGEGGVDVVLKRAEQTTVADVLSADALIFVAPENLAALAGSMKEFFDRTYYSLLDHTNGKPYAALICAGADGAGAQRQLERIATGLRLRRVAETVIVNTHAQSREAILAAKQIPPNELERCREIGAALGAGLSAGIF